MPENHVIAAETALGQGSGAEDEDRTRLCPVTEVATDWPIMPIETEIYLLPDGRVVIADMPVELTELIVALNGGCDPNE